MEFISTYIHYIARVMESAGVLTIAVGSLYVLLRYLVNLISSKEATYSKLRHDLGKMILLGLEILVAADIIATVSTEPTMNSVLVLAVIVLVRTFLSFSLQLELDGRLPWKSKPAEKSQI